MNALGGDHPALHSGMSTFIRRPAPAPTQVYPTLSRAFRTYSLTHALLHAHTRSLSPSASFETTHSSTSFNFPDQDLDQPSASGELNQTRTSGQGVARFESDGGVNSIRRPLINGIDHEDELVSHGQTSKSINHTTRLIKLTSANPGLALHEGRGF